MTRTVNSQLKIASWEFNPSPLVCRGIDTQMCNVHQYHERRLNEKIGTHCQSATSIHSLFFASGSRQLMGLVGIELTNAGTKILRLAFWR